MPRFSDLPDETMEEIMSWLPPESLRQFKTVQKSWYLRINALMNNPVFIARHLRNMKKRMSFAPVCHFSHLMTVPVGDEARKRRRIRVEENKYESEIEDDEFGRHLLVLANPDYSGWDYIFCNTADLRKLTSNIYSFKLVSQCDGIICLPDIVEGTVYLLNPALRELRIIHCLYYGTDYQIRDFGFGYDSRENEYKVVAFMTPTLDEAGDNDGDTCKAKVYSLSTDSWRETKCDIKSPRFDDDYEQVYCNGACYWYYWDGMMKMHCFNFSDEVFRYVSSPAGIRMPRNWVELEEWAKISVWKESAVLFVYPKEVQMVIDVWALDSQSHSWTKDLTIGPLEGIKRPLGFWDDVKLFLEDEDGEIKLYHLGSEVVSHLPKRVDRFQYDRFVIYQKSLVSVLRKEGRR